MTAALLLTLTLAAGPPLTTAEKITAASPAALGFVLGGLAGATALAFEESAPFSPITVMGGAALGAAAGGAVGAFFIDREADAPWAAVTAIIGVPVALLGGYGLAYPLVMVSFGLTGFALLAASSSNPGAYAWTGYAALGVLGLVVGGLGAAGAAGGTLGGLELGHQLRGWIEAKPVESQPAPRPKPPAPRDAPRDPSDGPGARVPPAPGPTDAPPPLLDDDDNSLDL